MLDELEVDKGLMQHLESRTTDDETRLMYRWATVFYYKKKPMFAISHAENSPAKNESLPFKQPDDTIATLQTVKRILVWQWNDKWVPVPQDELNALWSE